MTQTPSAPPGAEQAEPVEASDGDAVAHVVLALPSHPEPVDTARLCRRLQALLRQERPLRVSCDAGAVDRPDLAALDALARLQVVARRHGSRVEVTGLRPGMRGLVALAGLQEVLG